MSYISSDGRIGEWTVWRLSAIPEFLWGILNFIYLFIQTLINPDGSNIGSSQTNSHGSSGRRPPPGPPPRRMGRINHGGGPGAPPMAGGG